MSIRRVIEGGVKNFVRGGAVSTATVIIMTVTLGIICSLIFLLALLSYTLELANDKVGISVYFVPSAAESEILALKEKVGQLAQVELVEYTSREAALAEFRERHATDQTLLQGLTELGENPLLAYLHIRAKESTQYESIATTISTIPALSGGGLSIVSRINYADNDDVKLSIDRLSNAIFVVRAIGLAVVVVFALASIFIAFATIQLAIYTARDEISVMRLVGASNRYIRGPFIVVGIITGTLATLFVLVGSLGFLWYFGPRAEGYLGGLNLFEYYLANFFSIAGILLASGVLLGCAASMLAIRRYLKN